MNGHMSGRGDRASEARISYADSVLNFSRGKNSFGGAHKVTYRFSIDVPYHPAIADDTLRVWMPFPIESERQHEINILSAKPEEYIVSEPGQSVHRTIYFSAPVAEPGKNSFRIYRKFHNIRQLYLSGLYSRKYTSIRQKLRYVQAIHRYRSTAYRTARLSRLWK